MGKKLSPEEKAARKAARDAAKAAAKNTGANEVVTGYDALNGKVTKDGLQVTNHRLNRVTSCKDADHASEVYNQEVNESHPQ